jgi:DNA-binding PadR family transcriptional regulator
MRRYIERRYPAHRAGWRRSIVGDNGSRPLTESIYYTLLALGTPLHGYGIMQQVSALTEGRVTLGAGTLYGALTNLTEKGWIRPLTADKDERKKEYVISDEGRKVVADELTRLEELVRNGRRLVKEGER